MWMCHPRELRGMALTPSASASGEFMINVPLHSLSCPKLTILPFGFSILVHGPKRPKVGPFLSGSCGQPRQPLPSTTIEPKKPSDDSLVDNQQILVSTTVSIWCEMDFVHAQYVGVSSWLQTAPGPKACQASEGGGARRSEPEANRDRGTSSRV